MDEIYSFVLKGQLTQTRIDQEAQRETADHDVFQRLERSAGLHHLDPTHVDTARQMSVVYTAIAAFENSLRDLMRGVMVDEKGTDWWDNEVPSRLKKKAERRMAEEKRFRWHAQRGSDPLNYTDLSDLASLFLSNQEAFSGVIEADFEWVKNILHVMEKSRNVIMHSGRLDMEDVERLGILIRDWNRQVGI